MTNHSIKINRAIEKSKIGNHPNSAAAMLGHIPSTAIAALTSAQLAEMLDAMWDACQEAKKIAEKEAIENGAIYSGDRVYELTTPRDV